MFPAPKHTLPFGALNLLVDTWRIPEFPNFHANETPQWRLKVAAGHDPETRHGIPCTSVFSSAALGITMDMPLHLKTPLHLNANVNSVVF